MWVMLGAGVVAVITVLLIVVALRALQSPSAMSRPDASDQEVAASIMNDYCGTATPRERSGSATTASTATRRSSSTVLMGARSPSASSAPRPRPREPWRS